MRQTLWVTLAALALPSLMTSSLAYARDCRSLKPTLVVSAPGRAVTANDLVSIRDIGSGSGTSIGDGPLALSSDRTKVAFQLRRADPATNSYCHGVYVLDLRVGAEPRQIDSGGEFIMSRRAMSGVFGLPLGTPEGLALKWSPDGQWIGFLKRTDGIVQVWRAKADGTQSEAITSSEVDVETFAWSRDGTSIIVASRPKLLKLKRQADEESLRGFLLDDRIVPGRGIRPFPLEPIPREFSVVSIGDGVGRAATDEERLVVQPPASVGSSGMQISVKADRAWLQATGRTFGDRELRISSNGREIDCNAKVCQNGILGFWWSSDGSNIYVLRREGWGGSQVALLEWQPQNGKVRRVLQSDDRLSGCVDVGWQLVCLHETAVQPARISFVDLRTGKITLLLDLNPEFANIKLQPARRLHWRSATGAEVYGDLVLPPGHQPGERHPLIVVQYISRGFLRGGVGNDYPIQLFAAHGSAVLSFNQPESMAQKAQATDINGAIRAGVVGWQNRRNVDDALQRGIQLVESLGVADPERIGLTGLSDGAATVDFALANGGSYRAAAVSQLCDPAGYNFSFGPAHARSISAWGYPKISDPNAIEFWKKASITANPAALKTPLLVQVSDDEYLCGIVGFTALKELDRPVEMYVFPDEHHTKWQPAHRLANYTRSVAWFDFWLLGREDLHPLDPDQYNRWRAMRAKQSAAPN